MSRMTNVVAFEPREINVDNTTLIEAIELYLSMKEEKSQNTARNYKVFINEFLAYTIGKDMQSATWSELLSITYPKVMKFRNHLIAKVNEKGERLNSNTTINTKIASLKSLYRELNKTNRMIDTVVVDLPNLSIDESVDKSYGALTEEEMEKLYEFALGERSLGFPKKMFFEIAVTIAVRKTALLNIKWKDIKQEEEDGIKIWTIYTLDKGNKYDANPISDRFYSELVKLRGENDTEDDLVFKLNEKTLSRSLKRFCEVNNISEDRNITIHSLKKTSLDIVYERTNRDILATARHGHHRNIEMVYKHYQGKNKNLKDKPSYTFDEQIDISELEGYSKEELLEAITKCGTGVMISILSKLKEV